MTLGPLSLGALHHVLRASLGSAPSRPTLIRIVETSGGNPFFALAIARALPESEDRAPRCRSRPRSSSSSPASGPPLPGGSRGSPRGVRLVPPDRAHDRQRPRARGGRGSRGADGRSRPRPLPHPLLASAVYGSAHGTQLLELHRRLANVVDDPEERAQHLALCTTEADEAVAAELRRQLRARRGEAHRTPRPISTTLPPAHAGGGGRRSCAQARGQGGRAPRDRRSGDRTGTGERAAETAPPGPTRPTPCSS